MKKEDVLFEKILEEFEKDFYERLIKGDALEDINVTDYLRQNLTFDSETISDSDIAKYIFKEYVNGNIELKNLIEGYIYYSNDTLSEGLDNGLCALISRCYDNPEYNSDVVPLVTYIRNMVDKLVQKLLSDEGKEQIKDMLLNLSKKAAVELTIFNNDFANNEKLKQDFYIGDYNDITVKENSDIPEAIDYIYEYINDENEADVILDEISSEENSEEIMKEYLRIKELLDTELSLYVDLNNYPIIAKFIGKENPTIKDAIQATDGKNYILSDFNYFMEEHFNLCYMIPKAVEFGDEDYENESYYYFDIYKYMTKEFYLFILNNIASKFGLEIVEKTDCSDFREKYKFISTRKIADANNSHMSKKYRGLDSSWDEYINSVFYSGATFDADDDDWSFGSR